MEVLKIGLQYLIRIIEFAIVAQAIMSWFSNLTSHKIYYILSELTEPVLFPIRKLMSNLNTNIDFSPLVGYICLKLLDIFIERFL